MGAQSQTAWLSKFRHLSSMTHRCLLRNTFICVRNSEPGMWCVLRGVYLRFLLLLILVAAVLVLPFLFFSSSSSPSFTSFSFLFLLAAPAPSLCNNYYSVYFNRVVCQLCISKLLPLEPFFVTFTHRLLREVPIHYLKLHICLIYLVIFISWFF